MGLLLAVFGGLSLLWAVVELRALHRNYQAARLMGLPMVVVPYDPDGFLFGVLSEPLKPLLRRLLPPRARQAFDLTLWGWEWHDKGAAHERLGPAFVIVTTALNRLVTADPVMATAIMQRRRDFVHPKVTTQVMGLLGHNLITAADEDWSRQRRIIAPALNERISAGVWAESMEQAEGLVDSLLAPTTSYSSPGGSAASTDTVPGLREIAINVLKRVGYGRPAPYVLPRESESTPAPYADMSYVEAIALSSEMLLVAAFVPAAILRLPIMPRYVRRLGVALARLPKLTNDMLEQERLSSKSTKLRSDNASTESTSGPHTIMRTLLRLSDEAKEQDDGESATTINNKVGDRSQYLTEDEIAGNLFIFTAAGFDTTSNTLGYAVTLLAAYPQWQTWIQAEIDSVLYNGRRSEKGSSGSRPDYAGAFPRLVRCQAIMLETLRIFPVVTMLMRSTTVPQTIPCSPTSATESTKLPTLSIPAPCAVYVNTVALHTSRATWGEEDAMDFNPARWVKPATGTRESAETVEAEDAAPETLISSSGAGGVTPGSFLGWSSGPRKCPGQKMSQVEFVAVIATLFGRCRVEPDIGSDPAGSDEKTREESLCAARQRLLDVAQDSGILFTLAMNKPRDVRLRWTPRQQ
ncbi:cytochrome P450 [Microdochium trichocladiopsis]|uniref:Cytochrome P450 n=1 Tax=Microdochium trichocladiopsis TaxID=1682393 RepID=A0A9P8XUE5_9PEZI|nr:cytochrome P450 [Microdochium trichocladiopsis]KAH7018085.1 cytochrome P450 [Microdochium trichocladiopsis]